MSTAHSAAEPQPVQTHTAEQIDDLCSPVNLVSMVVMVRPPRLAEFETQLASIAGAEIHVASAEGKLVVTVEADDQRSLLQSVEAVQQLEAVIASNLVYHQVS